MEKTNEQKVYMVFVYEWSYTEGFKKELEGVFSSFENAKNYVLKAHECYKDIEIDDDKHKGFFQYDEDQKWTYSIWSMTLDHEFEDDIPMECNIPLDEEL